MNQVDKHIKTKLLQFPELFSSRWSVLEKMFLHLGSGYHWTSKGALEWPDFRANALVPDEVVVSDLNEQQTELDRVANRPGAGLATKLTQASLDLERLFRAHLERNIDLYVCTNLGGVRVSEQLIPVTLAQTPLGGVLTLSRIQPEWANAAQEVVDQLIGYFGRKLEAQRHQLSKPYQEQLGRLLEELQDISQALQRLRAKPRAAA